MKKDMDGAKLNNINPLTAKDLIMAVKDILVHIDDFPTTATRANLAADLGQRFQAHVAGLHVKRLPNVPVGVEFSNIPQEYFEIQQEEIDKHAEAARKIFEAAVRRVNVSNEWRVVTGYPSDAMLRQARYADLVVVGQKNPEANGQAEDLPDGLLLATGRPVLVVPNNMPVKSFGKNVLIAWNDSAAATRAVHDALPLIEPGAKVTVLAVNPERTGDHGQVPCADLCLHLARHGFETEAVALTAPAVGADDMLLARIFEQGCDLLVMGAYGHSRAREFVFGGVTAHILKQMTVPVLFSH